MRCSRQSTRSPLMACDRAQMGTVETNFWEFDFPLWKRLPAYCSTPAPQPLRFNGTVLLGGHVAFSLRLAPSIDDRLAAATAPLLVTLAAADDSLPEIYAHASGCAAALLLVHPLAISSLVLP